MTVALSLRGSYFLLCNRYNNVIHAWPGFARRELGGKRLVDRLRREGRRVLTRMQRHGTRPLAFPPLISNYISREVIKRYSNFPADSEDFAKTSENEAARA